MPTTLQKPPIEIGSVLGKFALRELLGEGGMGQVYRAEDTILHRQVAIKVLRPEFSQSNDFHQRFVREARLSASIEHECIVPIYDLAQDNGVWFLAMQLLQGETLHAYLKRENVPPLSVTLSILAQVLRGLAVAHAKGLIHRDIKPGNLWLEPTGATGKFRCRILDFGLACSDAVDGYQTEAGSGTFGTVYYMPFEQLNQEKVDHRADLYSLGVVLYEMLTGRLPYRSGSPVGQALEMFEGPPKPPHEVNPNLPLSLSALNLKMLLHSRQERIGSAVEILRELETIVVNPVGKPLFQGTLPDFSAELPTPNPASLKPVTSPTFLDAVDQAVPALKPGESHPSADTDLEVWTLHPQAPTVGFVSAIPDEVFDEALRRGVPTSFVHPNEEPKPEPTAAETVEELPQSPEGIVDVKPNRKSRRRLAIVSGAIILAGASWMLRGSPKMKTDAVVESHEAPAVVVTDVEPKHVAKIESKQPHAVPPKRSNLPAPAPLDCTGVSGVNDARVEAAGKTWADYLGVSTETAIDLGNGVSMRFVLVPPGKYLMGSSKVEIATAMRADPGLELKRLDREEPQRIVSITKAFYLGKFEVTREEFAALGGAVKSGRSTEVPRLPADKVSWRDAIEFCDKLTHHHLPPGFRKATLPTEAQWEYACRAGSRTPFHFGGELNGNVANCNGSTPFGSPTKGPFRERVVEVGQFAPNRFGLHDMHGNVAEWCLDDWHEFAYRTSGGNDPMVTGDGRDRVIRGGSWDDYPRFCRSACRNGTDADSRTDYIGFRVALVE